MQKAVLQLSIHDQRIRKKVFVKASGFPGIKSVEIDDKNEKMTVIGDIDATAITMKLRKICNTVIVTVEPVKKPETKPEPKKKPDPAKPEPFILSNSHYFSHVIVEEEPNICVIS